VRLDHSSHRFSVFISLHTGGWPLRPRRRQHPRPWRFPPISTLLFGLCASRVRNPRDLRPAIHASRVNKELALRTLPQAVVAVPAQEVCLEDELAVAAAWDVDATVLFNAHPEPGGLGFEILVVYELDG
jgi:hypothetical protein